MEMMLGRVFVEMFELISSPNGLIETPLIESQTKDLDMTNNRKANMRRKKENDIEFVVCL